MRLSDHFHAAGLSAVLGSPDAALVARANSLENFTLWFARTIDDGITGAVDTNDHAHCTWFDEFCRRDPPSYREPFIRQIAAAAYDQLRRDEHAAPSLMSD